MHELSIAYSIVEVVGEAAQAANAIRVDVVRIRLGALAGVAKGALLFSWDIATQATILAGAQLAIEELPVIVYCPTCQKNVTLPGTQNFRCPQCARLTAQIVQGRELEVKSLELVDGRDDDCSSS